MLLTIATLIAINAISSTVLEEKMAGNISNKHVSFQSAESGLRQAEQAAALLTDVTSFNGSNGLYPGSNPGDSYGVSGALANYPVWEDTVNTSWASGATSTGLPNPPKYIIEDYSESPRGPNLYKSLAHAAWLHVKSLSSYGSSRRLEQQFSNHTSIYIQAIVDIQEFILCNGNALC